MNRRHTEVPDTLNQVLQQFDQWRATQPVRTKLPEAFWQSAAEMARQHGLNLTAKTLRLDYTALKQKAFGPAVRQQEISPASFVELVSPQPVASCEECLIEFTSSRGSTIKIQWKGSVPPDWSKLLMAWRDAER